MAYELICIVKQNTSNNFYFAAVTNWYKCMGLSKYFTSKFNLT